MLYIITPTYNRVNVCREFVHFLENQSNQNYYLILIDHGKEKTCLQDNSHLKVINSSVNGWARAVNIGLKYVIQTREYGKDDSVLIINDDVVIKKDYLEQVECAIKAKPHAILGSCCIDKNNNKTLRVAIRLNRIKAKHIYLFQNITPKLIPYDFIDSDVLTGKGTVFPIEVLKQIGLYNERKLPHYKADHELVWRAKKKGIPVYVVKKMEVYTLSDQKKASKEESFVSTIKFFYFDMKSTINLRDLWNYAYLAYRFPYSLYFFIMNFCRNTMGMIIDYIRNK